MPITNPQLSAHRFLRDMYVSTYYPMHLVEELQEILERLCERIEAKRPENLEELYALTQAATEEINELQNDFFEEESELETVARDAIGTDFIAILKAYGFEDADVEEAIANRDW